MGWFGPSISRPRLSGTLHGGYVYMYTCIHVYIGVGVRGVRARGLGVAESAKTSGRAKTRPDHTIPWPAKALPRKQTELLVFINPSTLLFQHFLFITFAFMHRAQPTLVSRDSPSHPEKSARATYFLVSPHSRILAINTPCLSNPHSWICKGHGGGEGKKKKRCRVFLYPREV
jgi:hypothetical protein